MACNCLDEFPKKIIAFKQEQNPDWQIITEDAGFENQSFIFETPSRTVIGLPYRLPYTIASKSGKTLTKTDKFTIFMTYCPFCGKKYLEEPDGK